MLRFFGLAAEVTGIEPLSARLVRLRIAGDLYAAGAPVQYSHLRETLPLYAVQTRYAGEPWAVEMPSAGWALRIAQIQKWRAAGAEVVSLTHAAGLSATGDPAIDAALPLPERYRIPRTTMAAVERAQRVIAVGTSVVRALESAGPLEGVTSLRIGPTYTLRVVDAILTGMHEPGTTHRELLRAFVSEERLQAVEARAAALRFLSHEFGDSVLLW